jgi:uncharacterized protein
MIRSAHRELGYGTACLILGLTILLFSNISSVASPSFPCESAKLPDEVAICSSERLSELDVLQSNGYQESRKRIGKKAANKLTRNILKYRHACGDDLRCIAEVQIEAIKIYNLNGADIAIPNRLLNNDNHEEVPSSNTSSADSNSQQPSGSANAEGGNRCPSDPSKRYDNCTGTRKSSQGGKYVGFFRNNLPDGVGTAVFPDGSRYEGDFQEGKWTGQGIFYFGEGQWKGDFYDGQFVNGEFQGPGTYTFADGRRKVGEFSHGKLNGRGRIYSSGGDVIAEGVFEDDKLIPENAEQAASKAGSVVIPDSGQKSGLISSLGISKNTTTLAAIAAFIVFVFFLIFKLTHSAKCPNCSTRNSYSRAASRRVLSSSIRTKVTSKRVITRDSRGEVISQANVPVTQTYSVEDVLYEMSCKKCGHEWQVRRQE